NPDQEISEKDYEQAVLHSRAFQYDSIRDGQEKKEFWGQIASLAVIVGTSIICPPAGLALGIAYGTLELESAATGKDWISGRELGTGERVFRGVLAPLDIVPGVNGLSKFSSTVRLAHMGDVAELGLKTGIKAGIQRESRHVANMVIDAGKDSAARIRSAKAWAKEVPGRLRKGAENSAIGAARLADRTVTYMKNGIPPRQMGLAFEGGDIARMPAENTHDLENGVRTLLSKKNKVNLGHSESPNKDIKGKYSFDATSDMKGFGENIYKELEKHNITLEKFHELRLKPYNELTDEEVKILKNIRDAVPPITKQTLLQKTIPTSDIEKYLSGKYTQIGGYVAKVEDVANIRMYDDVVESSRLDYTTSDGSRPYPEGENSYGMIRFKTVKADKVSIPYGERFGGTNIDGPPCTQNGFTAARNGKIVPEWKFDKYYNPQNGAELYKVVNGNEYLLGIYSNGKFIKVDDLGGNHE
ncbi:hypothetical protein P9232_11795, partial [Weizmannia sp. CD-2023]|nr:hypothetical protein [Weizmannia sp. CD-2023]